MTKRLFLMLGTFASIIFLPWPCTAILALLSALFLPLLPLAAGIFADVLYWSPAASTLPLATLVGAGISLASLAVRGRLTTGIIER